MTLIKFSMFSRKPLSDKRPSFALPSVDSAALRAAVVGGCTQSALPFSTMASSGPSAPRNKQR
jgi:hypothetical protein